MCAVVLDAHSRRVIGWAVAGHLGRELSGGSFAHGPVRPAACARLDSSLRSRHPVRLRDYLTLLAEHGAQPSMIRVAIPTTTQSRVLHEDSPKKNKCVPSNGASRRTAR